LLAGRLAVRPRDVVFTTPCRALTAYGHIIAMIAFIRGADWPATRHRIDAVNPCCGRGEDPFAPARFATERDCLVTEMT